MAFHMMRLELCRTAPALLKRPASLHRRLLHPPKLLSIKSTLPESETTKERDHISITQDELQDLLKFSGKLTGSSLPSRVTTLAQVLDTDIRRGLSSHERRLEDRRVKFGSNRLKPLPPVSFLEVLLDALDDFTILILLASGALSLILEYSVAPGGEYGWVEGTAILLSVAVVVLVTSVTNFQKEMKFRELSAINEDVKAGTVVTE